MQINGTWENGDIYEDYDDPSIYQEKELEDLEFNGYGDDYLDEMYAEVDRFEGENRNVFLEEIYWIFNGD